MPKYAPMIGPEARAALNALGYDVRGADDAQQSMLGLIVSLATEISELRARVEQLSSVAHVHAPLANPRGE